MEKNDRKLLRMKKGWEKAREGEGKMAKQERKREKSKIVRKGGRERNIERLQ